jgi:hypothetical protein
MDKKEEQKGELEILKKRVDEISKDIHKFETKLERHFSKEKAIAKKEGRGYVRILVLLIIILLVLDVFSLIAYYKPDFSGLIKFNNNGTTPTNKNNDKPRVVTKCSDGTLEGKCSSDKPYYCYQGELLKNAHICGCPEGYTLNFQSCVLD